MELSPENRRLLLTYQRNEITEHHLYQRLARTADSPENRRLLEQIAQDELQHYEGWRHYTQQEVAPNRLQIWKYTWISRWLGFTFGIKLMERGEAGAGENYAALRGTIPEAAEFEQSENEHEEALIGLLDEERLKYAGSIVLGLNDALVELTGALAGLTLAFQNTRLIALSGCITGIAAALSMASSEYLSTKSEKTARNPLRASLYTGMTYLVTVLLLILPYLLLQNYYVCLALTLTGAVAIIALFNYYISVAQGVPFRKRFAEMAGLSLGVAALSFGVGYIARLLFGVEL